MNNNDEILLIGDVTKMVRLSTTSIWREINEGRFPKPDLIIGRSRRAWLNSTITKHINDLIAKQNAVAERKELQSNVA